MFGVVVFLGLLAVPSLRAEPGSNLWFEVGEKLVYQVNWGFIPVGTSVVTTEWIEEDGRRLLAIRFKTVTNHVVEKLYPVDDLVESIIDPDTFLPLRFVKRLNEGDYHCDELTVFDYKTLKARWEAKTSGKVKEFDIEADTRDIVSFMYFMRSTGFKAGDERAFRVMADEKIYDLTVKADKMETFGVGRFGKVPCVKLEPQAAFGGIFVRKGRMWMWVSDDSRHLCTKLAAQVPVAKVYIYLEEVHGPGEDFWVKSKEEEKKADADQESGEP